MIGVFLVFHGVQLADEVKRFVDDVRNEMRGLSDLVTVDYVMMSDDAKSLIDAIGRLRERGITNIIVCPLLVAEDRYESIVGAVKTALTSMSDVNVMLLDVMVRDQDFRSYVLLRILREVGLNVISDALRRHVMLSTGDPLLALDIAMNRDVKEIASVVSNANYVLLDDIRVISFIDTALLRSGVRIRFERDTSSFGYPPNALVVISSSTAYLSRVERSVGEGIRPCCLICTAPALTREEQQIKLRALEIGVPAVITRGSRGGPHVAGLVINALLSMSSKT